MKSRSIRLKHIRARLASTSVLIAVSLTFVHAIHGGWSRIESKTFAWLKSVFFLNQSRGWAVGSKGTLLITADGGRTWRQDKKFTNDNIRDVHFSDVEHGWLLCERDPYNISAKPPSYFLSTTNGGATWQTVELSDSTDRLVRFFFTRDGYGYAVGEGGALWQMIDDKSSWKRVVLPVKYLMSAATFLDDLRGVIVGGGGTVLFTNDGGLRWERATFETEPSHRLNSLFFADRENGWAVGASGTIYMTNNGGRSWRHQFSNTDANLSDVFFLSSREGVTVGDKGRILETKNGGTEWVTVATPVNSPLERVFFVGSVGFAVGYGGVILTNRP
jgi:photosystem II stability/assembly factor-like uncharacterized protein